MKLSRPKSHRRVSALLALLIVATMALPAAAAAPSGAAAAGPVKLYLPIVTNNYASLSYRLGYASGGGLRSYPEAPSLRAGWYVDWTVQQKPARPNGIEYMPVVRVHQTLTCPLYSTNAHDRDLCPYAVPHSYIVSPSRDQIASAARANRGQLWLIGNEMDRRDWPGGGQDEMLPELYAVAYNELYTLIKQNDPTARVAIGGVIQATPLRLEYLSKVWTSYQQKYGAAMPVDVWNVHNFILREEANKYGAGIPPGSNATSGVVYESDRTHIDMGIFDSQIRDFREWMRERGQQQKPLIVSEYGVLYAHEGLEDAATVGGFMESTFDYFRTYRECGLGLASDGCRLVQRWNWYSLDDMHTSFNQYGALFNPKTGQITQTGARFRDYAIKYQKELGQ